MKAEDNEWPKLILTPVDPATLTIPAGDLGLILDSTDSNIFKLLDDAGTATPVDSGGGGGGGLTAIPVVTSVVTSGNKSLGSTSYAAVDTGGAFDITIAAAVGDILEITLSTLILASGDPSNDNVNFTARTRVSGADVHTISGTASVTAWFAPEVPTGKVVTVAGTAFYTVVSGDVSGGNVTLRLYYKSDLASPTRTMFANATNPSVFSVKNLKH